ncbi:short transient receptor potential channel 7-like [Mytilus edulis]|uniref:short transient receptor potential channel 7-like n=1 Tax=Mytilus edulis TaxID=6550 RepID=UPI0039EF262C
MVRPRARTADNSLDSSYQRTGRDKRNVQKFTLGEKYHGFNRSLSTLEEEFIYAAEFGDIPTVQKILDENQAFNVDYHDIIGRTPLRLAVGNEHREVVELLLDRSNIANIHEALLQAISAGHEQIAETILKHPKYIDVKRENKRFGETDYFFNTTSEDSPFSADITPLILASERNQFEIIQLLLLRGDTINKPHHYYCNCQECSNKLQFDQLRLAKTRLNAYKGLASGAYISLSSKDPILTAFELARELRRVAKVEKYYKNEYLALADQLSEYLVKLLDKVRGHDELEILLNKKGRDSDDESYELLSRLKLAIHYNEKKFVAHPSCQQKLVSIWYDDLRSLERSNWFFRSMMVGCVTLTYPFIALLYMIAPKSKIGRFTKYPCIKFIGHAISFITFLIMIVVSSVSEMPNIANRNFSRNERNTAFVHYTEFRNTVISKHAHIPRALPEDFALRTFKPEVIHMLLTIWIVGMLWQELKQVYAEGFYDYFDSLYNYLDVAVLTLYITSFTMRYVSIMKVNESISYFESQNHWNALGNGSKQAESHWYWLPADRYFWHALDPHNISEGLFAIANIISFTRLSFLLPANELFGPMQISLARMITDILKFVIIFLVVFVAFMVGLHNLYWYYPVDVRSQVQFGNLSSNISAKAENHFGIIDKTFITVFWSLFGRGDPDVVELGDFDSYFIQNVGYVIFGAYNISTVIVLLNMLIAMMSRSFEIIQEEADTEWKFARTKLYMEYIRDDATLPIPFNIVPTPKALLRIFQFFCKSCCPQKSEADVKPHPGRVKDREMFNSANSPAAETATAGWEENRNGSSEQLKGIKRFRERNNTTNGFVRCDSDPNLVYVSLTYKRVMKRIVKRYIFDVQREDDASEVDFDELKQDISSFRYEMLNYVSKKDTHNELLADKVKYLDLKLNKLIDQQNILIASLLNTNNSSDQFRSLSVASSVSTCDSEILSGSGDSISSKRNIPNGTCSLLHDIQEEHIGETYSSIPSANTSSDVRQRTPSEKRRKFQKDEKELDPVCTEQVEMTVFDREDLKEVVVAHDELSSSRSGSIQDYHL